MKNYIIILLFSPLVLPAQNSEIKQTLIETLSTKDTLTIQFSRQSENPFRNKVKFYYSNGKMMAETTKDFKIEKTQVSPDNLKFIASLEKEGHSYNDQSLSCYNSDGYLYFINQEFKHRIIDQSCKWFGFEKLTEKLFGFK